MTDPDDPAPPPPPCSLEELRAEMLDMRDSIIHRLEDIDTRLHELLYNQRARADAARTVAMLEAALRAVRKTENGDTD